MMLYVRVIVNLSVYSSKVTERFENIVNLEIGSAGVSRLGPLFTDYYVFLVTANTAICMSISICLYHECASTTH